MTDIVSKLSNNIQLKILSYTYLPQPKHLLEDIRSYFSTHCIIHCYYYDRFNQISQTNENMWLHLIACDLLLYLNISNDAYCEYDYPDDFYNMFHRSFILQSKPTGIVNNYITKLNTKKITTRINILWGLYTPSERLNFIEYMYTK